MRQFKFRAWDRSRNKMVYEFSDNLKGKGYRLYHEERLFCGNYQDNGDWNEPELMQWTGLIDKNGKEIYEGDIVTFMDGSYISTENGIDTNEFMSTGVIEWCDERKGWDVTNREDVDTDECFDEYMEVIGNIHANLELL